MLADRLYDVYMNYISAIERWEALEKSVQLSILPWMVLNRWLLKGHLFLSAFLIYNDKTMCLCELMCEMICIQV
jgi:hypothetical protein